MKNRVIILITFLMGILVHVSAQSKLYEKFSEVDDVTSVFISKAILGLAPTIEGLEIEKVAENLDCLVVLSSTSKEAIAQLHSEIVHISANSAYEKLMYIKHENERTSFYVKKENERISELIMFVEEPNELTIIQLLGKIKIEDLQSIVNKKQAFNQPPLW